jgi:hypothetical protein
MSFAEFEKQFKGLEKSVKIIFKNLIKIILMMKMMMIRIIMKNLLVIIMNYIVLLVISHLNSIKRKERFVLFFLIKILFSFLNHENSRKHKEFIQLTKAHIQQENEELLLNNEEQINITNEKYDQIVQLPINNQQR